MKKLLLNFALILFSGFLTYVPGQNDIKGAALAVHEARFNVMNYTTREPVAKAVMYDRAGKQLGTTNTKGILVISLPASAVDLYTFKAQGFNPISIRLTQAAKKSADYEVFLPPAEGGVIVKDETQHAPPSPTENQEQELVKVYVKQDPTAYKKQTSGEESAVKFAVQLSATSRPITDVSSFKSWEALGPVFIQTENGLYKVRIGPFSTQEEAASVLVKVKAKGKSDAFIVVQSGIENHVPFDIDEHQAKENATQTEEKSITSPTVESMPKEPAAEYKVRLASYLKPGGFNTKDIDQYGPLESYRQGDWTIMLIGGFKTAKEAEKVRDEVIAKGYKDAVVVVDRGGVLESEKH